MHCKRMNCIDFTITFITYLLPRSYAPNQVEDGWGWKIVLRNYLLYDCILRVGDCAAVERCTKSEV